MIRRARRVQHLLRRQSGQRRAHEREFLVGGGAALATLVQARRTQDVFSRFMAALDRGGAGPDKHYQLQRQPRGFIDRSGRFVIPPQFDEADDFAANGLAAVRVNRQWGFIDIHGILAVPLTLPEPTREGFSRHGLAKVLLHPGRDPADRNVRSMGYGCIDTHGSVVIDKDDDDRVDAFQDAMAQPVARAVKAGRTGYLDTRGKLALGWYEAGTSFGPDGLAAVRVDGRFGYIDRQGRFAIAPAYEDARRFDGDTAVVRLHGKWGVIDHAGQLVVPFEYDKLDGFKDAAITLGTRAGRELGVDRHGSVVELPPLGPLRGVPVDEL